MKHHIGTFKTGKISITHGQKKWLARDLSKQTIHRLESILQNAIKIGCIPYTSQHLQRKIARGELTFDISVFDCALADFEASLIEYNETPLYGGRIEHRILLRPPSYVREIYLSSTGTTVPANLCFVLCLDTLQIITAYWNAVDDQHHTLQRSRYRTDRIKKST